MQRTLGSADFVGWFVVQTRATERPTTLEVARVTERLLLKRGTIRVFDDGTYWEWAGRRRRPEYHDAEAHIDDLAGVPARDLAGALRRARDLIGDVTVTVYVDGEADDDLEYMSESPVSFSLVGNNLMMTVNDYAGEIPEDERPTGQAAERVAPLLKRKHMWLVSADEDLNDDGRLWRVSLTIGFRLRGQSVADLVRDGLEVFELINATNGGLTRTTCADFIRAGHVHALLGQPEGPWLEVKREHYPLKETLGKLRIAQTVAQFANAEQGGLVIIGIATKRVDGIDTLNAVTAPAPDPTIRRKYIQALQAHLYPPPDDLSVEIIAATGVHGEGELVLVDVPPQPEEHKPFLVHGAIAEGRVFGSYFSIVTRRDDEAVSTTAPAVHATLAAGRALLRRGQLPEDNNAQG